MVPAPAPVWPPPRPRLPLAPIVATGALTLLVSVAGMFEWPVPALSGTSVWLVSDVPGALWVLLIGSSVLCVAVAVAITGRTVTLDRRDPVTLAWVALLLLSAATLVWNALYSAALSATLFGAIIPIFHLMFTFVPAVLAGALFNRRGRQACGAAALGTGVVTVPLFQLSSLLLFPGEGVATVLGALPLTGLLAVLPLVGAVASAGSFGGPTADNQGPHPFAG